jgi:hypothetical protein
MRILTFAAIAALVCCTACATRVVSSANPKPRPLPPHTVTGPVASLKIPPGHYPAPGECRLWFPGRPPGHQPPSSPCHSLHHDIPLGAWVLYRPIEDRKVIELTAYHEAEPRVVVSVSYYDAKTGRFLRARKLR